MEVKKDMCDESTDESQSTEENPYTLNEDSDYWIEKGVKKSKRKK